MATTRIRTVKPQFFGSPDTGRASFPARILFQAMWCWADDWGYGETNVKGLNAFAFEHDDMTDEQVRGLLREVADCWGVVFYSHRGRFYYQIPSWDEHQKTQRRANKKHPKPEDPGSAPDLRFCDRLGVSESSQGNSFPSQGNVGSGKGMGRGKGIGNGEEEHPEPEPDTDEPDTPSSTASVPAELERDDVTRLCEHLRDRIVENGSRRPNISKGWRDAARLLLDKDGVSEAEAHRLIDWCQADGFWRSNILSLPKFREQFDKIRLQANRPAPQSRFGRPSMTDNVQSLTRARNHLIASTADPVDSQPTLMLVSPQNHDERPF